MDCAVPRFPRAMLQRLWLYVTFDCNLSCSYCISRSDPPVRRPSLTVDGFRALVDEAVRMRFRQVAISGGEPFIHPDVLAMLEYATRRVNTVVLTNGTLLETPSLSELAGLNRRNLTVQVSLDSADPQFHDSHRGRGCWDRTVRGIRLLLDLDFSVTVRATITEQSDEELVDLYQFLEELGVRRSRCYCMPLARGGRSPDGVEYSLGDLVPEPTVAADGLYWHPLKVDPSLAIASRFIPLEAGLARMSEVVREVRPPCSSHGFR